ncbi:CehA/McbA family metallohydrolase [Maioricimonas sp. JC845]|uniref:CehA/McbA family metallohydrolase n=1 Tax=Maioricimonas sp. JC845 TaxID=3232138 RepID=UPI003459F47D
MRGCLRTVTLPTIALLIGLLLPVDHAAAELNRPAVEGQPLAANVRRLVQALDFLGTPLPDETTAQLQTAIKQRDAARLQTLLDDHVLLAVDINPELRVKVTRGPARAHIQQSGFTPVIVKVINGGTVTERLRIGSPQAGAAFGGASEFSLKRQQQTELGAGQRSDDAGERFLDLQMFASPPMTPRLSGLEVEYALALVSSSEAGRREATITFDIGQGTQDLGFRGEVPVLFDVAPAIPVRLQIRDFDGQPTVARLTFRDRTGRVYPLQAKRTAPDFFFQPQIYRRDGDVVLLPPGAFDVTFSRGPEYVVRSTRLDVPSNGDPVLDVQLERWVDPMEYGFYCGDHHIHGAGCAHYQIPTEGVTPRDMFLQVKGEGLNVGCVLTWGPCFDHQRHFFSPLADAVSEPLTVLKYDLEISGFGSAAMGHVCLLNLENQTYPGSEGTSNRGWPSWTVPVMRWAKQQGGVTGYPHSDMRVDPASASARLLKRFDKSADGFLDANEAVAALLPSSFQSMDSDEDGRLNRQELAVGCDRAANDLPNVVLPAMTGAGAMEIFVSTPEGVCDFISAMDTGRVGEWNTWYHLMNCGFPLKLSGETDFPCMSSRRVGQGRVYVQLGDVKSINFTNWCRGLGNGRSYVSDGYAHALDFRVSGVAPGLDDIALESPETVAVAAKVAFAPETPEAVAHGTLDAPVARREVGDTRVLHAPRSEGTVAGGEREVELVMNGRVVAKRTVPADGQVHELSFEVPVERSGWIALRQFPQLHTNPVRVIVGGAPIRASRRSAQWCAESVELLWDNRSRMIREEERAAADAAYRRAVERYRQIAAEAPAGS